ncbi:MAG: NAD(P)/FAD-dependent oxidoreductase [Bacteroidota bacterium]|nr:NAD(P)/FAD-dependent oxidoreductase [Bacteroidota bacterium]
MENTLCDVKKIVIVGGGFAGLNLARQLFKSKNYDITLVDKNNYNYFTPLLYQVATSFLEPSSISYPFRKILRNKKVKFRMGEVVKVDPEKQIVYLDNGELYYDHLVFAAGAKTNFYDIKSVEKNAISIKGVHDALRMRDTLLKMLEKAAICTDDAECKKLLTIVVAGGGPTGVEVAGMLAEMKNYIFAKDYPDLKHITRKIYIVDSGPYLLAPMSDKSRKETYDALVNLGVEVRLNTRVTNYNNGIITFNNGDIIEAGTLMWAAGIIAHTFDGIPLTSLGAGRRMITDEYNRVNNLSNIWAIGDICLQQTDPVYPNGHPQLAQVAIQQGRTLAKNFLAIEHGKALKPFKYFDRGEMAIVGRHNAVVDLFKHRVHMRGFAALFIWLFIHLVSLVNYNNKLRTLYSWAIAYMTRDQALRMIFRS